MIPALVIGFDSLSKVENRIAELRTCGINPIYVFLDGYRPFSGPGDNSARVELEQFLKQCLDKGLITSLYMSKNHLGLGRAIPAALDWFFQNNSMGMIIEDDCRLNVKSLEFIHSAIELLSSQPASIVCLSNPMPSRPLSGIDGSFFFQSSFFSSWGWMSTREVWRHNRVRHISPREVFSASLKNHRLSFRKRLLLFLSWIDIWISLRNDQDRLWAFRYTIILLINEVTIFYPEIKVIQHEPSKLSTNVSKNPSWDSKSTFDFENNHISSHLRIQENGLLERYIATYVQGASLPSLFIRKLYQVNLSLNHCRHATLSKVKQLLNI